MYKEEEIEAAIIESSEELVKKYCDINDTEKVELKFTTVRKPSSNINKIDFEPLFKVTIPSKNKAVFVKVNLQDQIKNLHTSEAIINMASIGYNVPSFAYIPSHLVPTLNKKLDFMISDDAASFIEKDYIDSTQISSVQGNHLEQFKPMTEYQALDLMRLHVKYGLGDNKSDNMKIIKKLIKRQR